MLVLMKNSRLIFDLNAAPEDIHRALRDDACVIIERVLDPAPLRRLHEAAVALFENHDVQSDQIVRHRGWCSGSWLTQRILGDELYIAKVLDERLGRLFPSLLTKPALHPLGHVRYRHHADPSTALPFHQHPHEDAGGELSPGRIRMMNVLIPFTDFDGACSDMQYVAKATSHLYPVTDTPETQFASFELNKAPILDAYTEHLWRPKMNVGDVALFRDGTLHRTFTGPDLQRQRTSIDLRVFDADDPLSVYAGSPGLHLPGLQPF